MTDTHTALEMFDLGWFGRGRAFWRWVETPAAQPYVAACAAMRRRPEAEEWFDASGQDDAMSILDDLTALADLAARIEADYGDGAQG